MKCHQNPVPGYNNIVLFLIFCPFFQAWVTKANSLLIWTRRKESTKLRITQNKGKERENSYQKLKRSPNERHIQTHGSLIKICWGSQQSFSNRKTAVIVKIFQLSFRVFACAFPMEISSIFGKSFPSPFPYFVLFVLRYFPFHVVWNIIWCRIIDSTIWVLWLFLKENLKLGCSCFDIFYINFVSNLTNISDFFQLIRAFIRYKCLNNL